jgi:hypothetical protein
MFATDSHPDYDAQRWGFVADSDFVLEKSKCYVHISLFSALSCFAKCICKSYGKRPRIHGLFWVWVLGLEIYMECPLEFALRRGM